MNYIFDDSCDDDYRQRSDHIHRREMEAIHQNGSVVSVCFQVIFPSFLILNFEQCFFHLSIIL